MPETASVSTAASLTSVQEKVLEVVRELAAELGGARAARATALEASLERDLGLGSLERVELLLRLESAFGRPLGDACLQIDTPGGLARALIEAAGAEASLVGERSAEVAPASPLAGASTLQEVLWRRAQADPNRPHVYMREEDGTEHVVTYGRLLAAASTVAAGLRARGVARGDRVALMLPTGFDFLRSFQGILLAGAVPVPIYPPLRLDRLREYAERHAAILDNAEARLLVTIDKARPIAALLRAAVRSLREVTTADDLAAAAGPIPDLEGSASDAALIQYTSGSTGQPRGVLLTHANLLANVQAIGEGLHVQPTDVGASWLPLYHDMGLIGSWLFCLYQGLPIDIQSPLAFLSRPERWLWAIHRRRATLSPAPNFAYELCLRRIPDGALAGLDLSSWRCAFNGAEPVSPDTLERFARRFAPYGLRPEALMPVYGLAENAVALCFPPPGRGPRTIRLAREPFEREGRVERPADDDASALRLLSVGSPVPGHEVRILDEQGRDLPEGRVGRLVFRGPSMTSGYFRQPEATAAMTVDGGWLDSGDLAFRAEGEVYVAGRVKDLIIKGGRNLVPQEIEEIAAGVPGIRKGCVVALGVQRPELGTESLVVVAETRVRGREAADRLAAAVTERLSDELGLPPDAVHLVPPGSIPKTSSGKLRRAETRQLHLSGELGRAPRGGLATRTRLVMAAAGDQARRNLRAAAGAAYGGWVAGVASAVVLVLWPIAMVLPGRRRTAAVGRLGVRTVLRLAGFRLRAEGLDNLAGPGPFVLAANHASYADVPALMALLRLDFLFVAKKEVLRWPLVGAFVRKAGHLTVDRWDSQQGVADTAAVASALREGRSVLFFPEGTFTATAGLRPFRLGAFKAAAETGLPVVPLALRGTRRALRAGGWRPRRGEIALWVGTPLTTEASGWRAVVDLRDRVSSAIAARCGEPRLDLVASGPERP